MGLPKGVSIYGGGGYLSFVVEIQKKVTLTAKEVERAKSIFGPKPFVCIQEYS